MKRSLVAMALFLIAPALFADSAAADGAAVFKSRCVMCHGGDGAGQTGMGKSLKLRDLGSADVQKQTDAQLANIVTVGKGKMPAYKGKLAAAEIEAVVKFLRSMK
ncbi:MAG: cytochrome c6 [Acidobacteriota bacterium]|jgi:mono/diheme cytochrome c family protein|nr:cytochrome c6 [Acidobacteriota bacterium]